MEIDKLTNALEDKEAYANTITNMVKQVVSSYYNMPISAFQSKSRLRPVIRMKQTCVYFIKKFLPKATLMYIGQHTNYDHCSVIYSIKQIENLYEFNKETKQDIDTIRQVIEIEQDKLRLNGDLFKEFYYVDLSVCDSIKLIDGRTIVISGYNTEQKSALIELLNNFYQQNLELHKHNNTGVYILEKQD